MGGQGAAPSLSMRTLFISDLHLSPADPATATAFSEFLLGPAQHAAALYILGDLFEYWVGDDQLNDAFYAEQCRHLVELAVTGVPIYFMPGNRDFLCGQRFALACGLTILPDPTMISIGQERILLAHGDAYCTADRSYQRFRRIVRNPVVQWIWFHLPRALRNGEARRLRQRSALQTSKKPASHIDVCPTTIEVVLSQSDAHLLIHGHTHRPARHTHHHGIRRVLPDWSEGIGGYLQHDGTGWHLHWIDVSAPADPSHNQTS